LAEENKSKEAEILAKLDSIAKSLTDVQPAEYTNKDLQEVYDAIEEIRAEVDKLEENYHKLDKQTEKFIEKLNSLEKDIDDFEKSEGVSEEKTKTFVTGVVMSLATGVITYVFSQMKAW